MHSVTMSRPRGRQILNRIGAAELASAGILALCVPYIVINESFANWQSLWLCAALAAFAFSLVLVRDARN
jgi:hypothetical protein